MASIRCGVSRVAWGEIVKMRARALQIEPRRHYIVVTVVGCKGSKGVDRHRTLAEAENGHGAKRATRRDAFFRAA
jgi:hypothetical protein